MKSIEELKAIVARFDVKGGIQEIKPLGNGLINDTLLVKTDGPDNYVLQRVNNAIFKDVDLLQHNIDCATAHIRRKLAGDPDIDRKVLTFIPCKETGKTYWTDGKTYWRVSVFIKDAFTYETVNPEYSYYAGKAFGQFEAMLSDIPDTLGETIPDFHNMELRARQLAEAVAADPVGRMAEPEVQAILADLKPYEEEMCKAERLYREGILPKRICHCDTKVNNMMFDKDGNILCVIDLDTLMPSFVFSDFGDFLRTAANTVAEDDPAVEKVDFKMDIFEAFAKGYVDSRWTSSRPSPRAMWNPPRCSSPPSRRRTSRMPPASSRTCRPSASSRITSTVTRTTRSSIRSTTSSAPATRWPCSTPPTPRCRR